MSDMLVALVTGASRGIGLEVCRQLAQQGFIVILGGRDFAKAQEVCAPLIQAGLSVIPRPLDVTDAQSIEALCAWVDAGYGHLDVLVNNAAAFADWSETASKANLATAHAILETNLFGTWQMIQTFLPLLRKSQQPRIVNVSSGGGSHGDMQFGLTTNQGGSASYGISKAALNALTTKFAVELQGTGILVNAVCPGFTATAPGMAEMGARPIPDGAKGIVWAATLPDDGPSGGFFRDEKPLPW